MAIAHGNPVVKFEILYIYLGVVVDWKSKSQ